MKIVTGDLRGAKLSGPGKKDTFRPTENRTREALFNILNSSGRHGSFLDVFAGSGAVGIEAFSRGFSPVTLVENNKEHANIIRENLEKISNNFSINGELPTLFQRRARDFLQRSKELYDVVFADPPYAMVKDPFVKELLSLLPLKEGGIFILEHGNKIRVLKEYNEWIMEKQFEYGHCKLSFFIKKQ
jgi:16S rRNA (guanine(966)-N(2))-methyltransferase RsmD